MTEINNKPRAAVETVKLENGETLTVKSFSALQVLDDPRIALSFADIYKTVQAVNEAAQTKLENALIDAGVSLKTAAAMTDAEREAQGFVYQAPHVADIIAACQPALSALIRASLPDRDDTFWEELGVDELMALVHAVYKVNSVRYAKKLEETLKTLAIQGLAKPA